MKRVYVDMDGVLADFDKKVSEVGRDAMRTQGFFLNLEPMAGAVPAWITLASNFDTYILTTPSWTNPYCWSEKRLWVEKHLGRSAYKRLIMSHNKGLLMGDVLIDDRVVNGVAEFQGEHVHFGSRRFPDWDTVLRHLMA